jgi:acyl carrier protein
MKYYDELKEVIAEVLGVDESEITPETKFAEDLDADSLDITEIIMGMEEKLNVKLIDDDADADQIAEIKTVQDAMDRIEEVLGK